jgi:hypothetical protein
MTNVLFQELARGRQGLDLRAQNVLYVSKDGNDSNTGQTLGTAKLTVKSAVEGAPSGTTVFVKSGDYTEDNPISTPAGVSVVADNLRTVSIRPANPTQDIFLVRNRNFFTGMTFRDHVDGAACFAFPPDGTPANNVIFTSPYIQDCSSITTTGVGMRIDGSKAGGFKSMVSDAFTQYNQGGKGVHILNSGYAQLVSIFTICCEDGFLVESGGFCSITNSNSSFGLRGLRAVGKSPLLRAGAVNGAGQRRDTLVVDGLSVRPNVAESITIGSNPQLYTIKDVTELENSEVTLTLLENLVEEPDDNATVNFYQRSLITTSSHTFEFVGSGTDPITAAPQFGGRPDQTLEVVEEDGGKVNFTSTDQWGDFRIGNDLMINNAKGTIEGQTFDRSLFAVLTPYILAIEN